MELAPRYCRSCGSKILVKHVCHNCNRNPLDGDNYCYDCGALTPNADSCLKCGARYKKNFPIKPLLIFATLLIITIAAVGYFLSRPNTPPLASQQQIPAEQSQPLPEIKQQPLPVTHDTIVNKATDSAILIANKPIDSALIKTPADTAKKIQADIFTSEELKAYKIKCAYFEKKQKTQVLFFISGGLGYIKMNEKIYELTRKRKGVDVAVYANDEFEATIIIDGLSGNAKEWLASCTLILKDLYQTTSVKHKVYSYCIEL